MARVHAGVALASGAALLLQVSLVRVFSVAQWHHLAFVAVGLGLLGFGASGTALSSSRRLRRAPLRTAAWGAAAFLPATALALLAVWKVPFDAYLMALEPIQSAFLALQLMALVLPFLCAGLVTGAVLAALPERAGSLYAASFVGAAAGAIAALPVLGLVGGPGGMVASAAVAMAGAAALWREDRAPATAAGRRSVRVMPTVALAAVVVLGLTAGAAPEIPISQYKSLSQIRRYPESRLEFSARSAGSSVDVTRSPALRFAPGLSLTYAGVPPSLPGLTVDGDGLRGLPVHGDASFTAYLPTAIAYGLSPGSALVVGVGVEVLGALHHGMDPVVVVEGNPLVAQAATAIPGSLVRRANTPRTPLSTVMPGPALAQMVGENPRTYLRRSRVLYNVIQVPPQESFQVVASGAFSLAENHLMTVEALGDYLRGLAPGGVLAVTRWVQTPPSEEVRAWAAAVAALEGPAHGGPAAPGGAVAGKVMALRSMNTLTILVKPSGFGADDVARVRAFCAARHFDITYAPGVDPAEGNRYNVLPEDLHHEAFVAILSPQRREGFLAAFPFDVSPSRDDRPFFFHFFRWRQVPAVLGNLGRTWQPFGGGGYLILLVLLTVVTLLSAVLIVAPLRWMGDASAPVGGQPRRTAAVFAYFLALGFGYLFVEIPLVQQLILVLTHPTYAFAAVLAGLLLSSGVGSMLSARIGRGLRWAVLAVAAAALAFAWALPAIVDSALGLTLAARIALLGSVMLPLGVLMGMPFPAAVRLLGRRDPALVPWAWAINGCASVMGSIAAALLALDWGFSTVVACGGLAYAVAFVAIIALPAARTSPPPDCETSIGRLPS